MGSWIHDGFLDSWNPCVRDFRISNLLESIIGFNKSFVQWVGIEVKNKKLIPICICCVFLFLFSVQMGPGTRFPTNPDIVDILGRTDLDFDSLFF